MTEIGAIVGIYGEVDRAAQTDAKLRTAVSQLLPLYADPGLHWYDDFEAWLSGTRAEAEAEAEGTLFPSLPDALHELADIEPRRRMRPRRLFAIAVAMRAFPEMRDPHSELGALAVGALRVSALAGKEKQALALHELLAEEESLPSIEGTPQELSTWWDDLVAKADSEGLISSTTGMRPRPCSGRLVNVPGIVGEVAALETVFQTNEVDFDQAIRFLEPETWPKCMPWFWCEMKQIGAGPPPLYKEVVSTDCAHKAGAAFTAETELDFEFRWLGQKAKPPKGALTAYRLAPGRPEPGDLIRVDEGSLVVEKIRAGQRPLMITTTKRIQFSYPFSSEALATIMCALGYTEAVAELLCCAASGSKKGGNPFPGGSTVENDPVSGAVPVSGAAPGGVVAALSGCIEECAAALGDWSRRIAEGPYTTDELAQDMTNTWARVLRKGATAVEVGARATQTGARTRPRERSED